MPDLTIAGLADTDRPQIKDLVYERLVEAVVSQELPPGTHLKERDLAESMGVSKTPIREALVRMEKERLVDIAPYRGAVVRTITVADLRELYDLRELLEGFCARRAAMTFDDAQQDRLRRNIHASKQAVARSDEVVARSLLQDFDELLHEAAQGHRVGSLLVDLETQLGLLGRVASRAEGRFEASIAEHTAVLHAIVTRDPDDAERLCRQHIRSVYADLLDQIPLEDEPVP
ncbi:GntR family transcriptional regulator [Kineosporia sp. NBRC 101731]|uniref:GntR family transcriptional regulator n=1 Tax=Kineosporia sp. NBRC 101731 TaxID=3032199 RepID=UPI00255372FC|nr:GntR family transcriptional regulator [Kineosporia sp. NBRC 101731]